MDKFVVKRKRVSIGSSSASTRRESHNAEENVIVDSNSDQRQGVTYVVGRGITVKEKEYQTRLTATLDMVRFLLNQDLPFRGDDESSTSLNKGHFLELLEWYGLRNDEVGKVILKNSPANIEMIFPSILKDVVNACATETTLEILRELGDRFFSVIIDVSRDCSMEEQMAIVIRFVNKNGQIIERFLALVHVKETTSVCLREAIDSVFAKFELSLSRLRGQVYNGASNMRDQFNGLKTLILKENPSAWYVHCFGHQLQLVYVAVCKTNQYVCDFFSYLNLIVTLCGSTCKRANKLQQTEHDRLVEMIENCTSRVPNQEIQLKTPSDTRWGSHYATIIRLICMWHSVTEVLENILIDGVDLETRGRAVGVLQKMETYEFVFIMILMKDLLGPILPLSCALQQRDQGILTAFYLIEIMKERLRSFREFGWDTFLQQVNDFCGANDISITNMDDVAPRRIRMRNGANISNYHHYRVEIFCQVVDLLTPEMENRFSGSFTDLLSCMACLDPKNGFSAFNVGKLVHLASLYPEDFSSADRMMLSKELETFVDDVRTDARLIGIEDLGSLSQKIVETKKDKKFPLVYRLIELVLLLPVASASVERVSSAMEFVKIDLQNRTGDDWLNDTFVIYNERSIFNTVSNERILKRFQDMDTRRS